MLPPTPKQVREEIAALEEIKPKVPTHNGFGEDNHAAIDAQITVLMERMDNDQIYDTFGLLEGDSSSEESEEDEGEEPSRVELEAALDALHWMEGDEESPSIGWRELVP